MKLSDNRDALLLRPGTRLLHIGPMKTGSTALQNAAAEARARIYENGAYYPGRELNHRQAIFSFLGKVDNWSLAGRDATRADAAQAPSIAAWNALLADIEAEDPSRRILISHEVTAGASTAMARKLVSELGADRVHIAITLRSQSATLVSRWTQGLKEGWTGSFDDWLRRFYGEKTARPVDERIREHQNHAGLVERWAEIVGPENVTVIIADTARKNVLTNAFERLLGLPEDTLTEAATDGARANRAMSLPEAELFRRVNSGAEQQNLPWPMYLGVIRSGAVYHLLGQRLPDAAEPRVRMPRWAAERAVRDGQAHALRIRQSGVRIVGDLGELYSEPSVAEDEAKSVSKEQQLILAIAAEALCGAIRGAEKSESLTVKQLFERGDQTGRSLRDYLKNRTFNELQQVVADSFTIRELASALKTRLWRRIRTGRSGPADKARVDPT